MSIQFSELRAWLGYWA